MGLVFALLLALEVLNALFEAVVQGLARDMARTGPVPAWLYVPTVLRWLLAMLARIGTSTSLVVHELSHALAQFVFGGRPRVVFLKNGGYAQSQEWGGGPLRLVHIVGMYLGRGVMCTAPILVGATLLVAGFILITPMSVADVVSVGRAIGIDPHDVHGVLGGIWHAFAAARWWTYPIAVVAGLLLAPGMTPSSVDYVHGRMHLLAYAIAALACTGVARYAPHALWFAAPIAAVAGFGAIVRGPEWLRSLAGGLGLSTGVLALVLAVVAWRTGTTPLAALHTGLGVIVYALAIAALVYVAFVGVFLALSLISIRPLTLWYALVAAPRQLIDLVRPFSTCDACRMHYRGKCEGCGRTPDAPAQR